MALHSPGPAHDAEVATGEARQETIRNLLESLTDKTSGAVPLPQDRDPWGNSVPPVFVANG